MIEDLPLLSINVKIWRHCGFIKFKSYWRSIAISFIPTVMNVFELMFFIKNWGNVEILILSSFMVCILFNSIVRIGSVLLNQDEFLRFMEEIVEWVKEAERRNDAAAVKVLHAVASKGDKLSKLSLFLGSIGAFMTAIMPQFMKERELPFSVWIPGIDVLQSPYYEIIYGCQVTFVMPYIIVTYIPFTNLFICWLMFGIATLQVLQNKLECLMKPPTTAEELEIQLGNCIQYHNKIISFADKLNIMLSLTHLMEFLMFSLMLCVLLFFILLIDNLMLQVNAAIYIMSILYVVLLFYWHANEFSCESLKIAEAAYSTDWTSGSLKFKKSILIIILRSQNTLQMFAGGMYPMTLETFQSLLSASYSYFTVLKGMHE